MEPRVAESINAFLAEVYGIEVQEIQKLTRGFVNDSFLVTSDSQSKYVLRISHAKTADEVRFEIDMLRRLEAAEFISPRVVPSIGGEYLAKYENRAAVIFEYIEGDVTESFDTSQLFELGRNIGRMHACLENFHPIYTKSTWEPDALVPLYVMGRGELLHIDAPETLEVVAFCDKHVSVFGTKIDLPQGVTHQDIKRDNIIVNHGEIKGIIDFDNAYYGTLLYDFLTAVMWEGYVDLELSEERVSALAAGYQGVRKFTAEEKDNVVHAFKARLVREVFIGPFAALQNKEIAVKRALEFIQKFNLFDSTQEGILFASITKN